MVEAPTPPSPRPRDEAEFWLERNRADRAEAPLRAALAADPDDADLQIAWAHLRHEHGDHEEALAAAHHALALSPDSWWYHLSISGFALAADDVRQARRHARLAVRLAPGNPDAHVAISMVLARAGRGDAAVEHAQIALAIDPGDTAAWCALAAGHLSANRWKPAQEAAERARALSPSDPGVLGLNATLAETAGRGRAAATAFRQSLSRRPDWILAQKGLANSYRLRHPVRGWIIRMGFWLSRLPPALLLFAVAGVFWVMHPHLGLARFVPAARPFAAALRVIIVSLAWLACMSAPLANLPLLLRRDERHLLTHLERQQSLVANLAVALTAALGASALAAWWTNAPPPARQAWSTATGLIAVAGLCATASLDVGFCRSRRSVLIGSALLGTAAVSVVVGVLTGLEANGSIAKDHWAWFVGLGGFVGACWLGYVTARGYLDGAVQRARGHRRRARR